MKVIGALAVLATLVGCSNMVDHVGTHASALEFAPTGGSYEATTRHTSDNPADSCGPIVSNFIDVEIEPIDADSYIERGLVDGQVLSEATCVLSGQSASCGTGEPAVIVFGDTVVTIEPLVKTHAAWTSSHQFNEVYQQRATCEGSLCTLLGGPNFGEQPCISHGQATYDLVPQS